MILWDGFGFSYIQNYICMFVGVEAWTFEQKIGEAVFIPAGCPHQVRNMKVIDPPCIAVKVNKLYVWTNYVY